MARQNIVISPVDDAQSTSAGTKTVLFTSVVTPVTARVIPSTTDATSTIDAKTKPISSSDRKQIQHFVNMLTNFAPTERRRQLKAVTNCYAYNLRQINKCVDNISYFQSEDCTHVGIPTAEGKKIYDAILESIARHAFDCNLDLSKCEDQLKISRWGTPALKRLLETVATKQKEIFTPEEFARLPSVSFVNYIKLFKAGVLKQAGAESEKTRADTTSSVDRLFNQASKKTAETGINRKAWLLSIKKFKKAPMLKQLAFVQKHGELPTEIKMNSAGGVVSLMMTQLLYDAFNVQSPHTKNALESQKVFIPAEWVFSVLNEQILRADTPAYSTAKTVSEKVTPVEPTGYAAAVFTPPQTRVSIGQQWESLVKGCMRHIKTYKAGDPIVTAEGFILDQTNHTTMPNMPEFTTNDKGQLVPWAFTTNTVMGQYVWKKAQNIRARLAAKDEEPTTTTALTNDDKWDSAFEQAEVESQYNTSSMTNSAFAATAAY